MSYYYLTDTNGEKIGERVYLKLPLAMAVAKRAAKARAKSRNNLSGGVRVMQCTGSLYDQRIATIDGYAA